MEENSPSLACVAYQPQSYRTGRDLGDCVSKPPIFLTSEELEKAMCGGGSFLEAFRDESFMACICIRNEWRFPHSWLGTSLPEDIPLDQGLANYSPQATHFWK